MPTLLSLYSKYTMKFVRVRIAQKAKGKACFYSPHRI